jgi:hypothetical protein
LIIVEDPTTREIVIANSDGREIAAITPEEDYNPYWHLEMMHPDLYSGLYSQVHQHRLVMFRDLSKRDLVAKMSQLNILDGT